MTTSSFTSDASDRGRGRARDLAPRKRPKQARACATFEAVVEAAARILTREGYAALTMEHLASVAGVGVGSVYEYFPSKETIVAEVVRNLVDDLARELAAGASYPISEGPEAWIRRWVHAMFEAVGARRDLLRTLFDEVPYLDEIEEVRQFPARVFALATNSPREMTGLPYVNRASTFMLTTMIRSAVLESVIDPPDGVSAHQLEDTLVMMLLALLAHGLSAAAQRGS
jgi:AcrR family transcriptional regulator